MTLLDRERGMATGVITAGVRSLHLTELPEYSFAGQKRTIQNLSHMFTNECTQSTAMGVKQRKCVGFTCHGGTATHVESLGFTCRGGTDACQGETTMPGMETHLKNVDLACNEAKGETVMPAGSADATGHVKSVDLACHESMPDPPVDMEMGTTQGAAGPWKSTPLERLRLARVEWEDTWICNRLRPFLELWQKTPCVIIKTPPSRAPHQNANPSVDTTARPEVCTNCRYSDQNNGMRNSIVTVLAKVREIWANSDINYIGRLGAQELSLILVHRLALGPPNRFRTAIKNVHKSDNDAKRIALVCSVLAIKFYSSAENTDNILRILSVPDHIGHNFERLEIPCFEALNWNVVQQPCMWSLLLSAGLVQPFAEDEASMKGFDVAIQLLYRSNTSETAFGIVESDPPLAALAVYQFMIGAIHMQSANLFAPAGSELVVRAYARILEAGQLAAMYIDAYASTRLGFFDDPNSDFPTERHVTAMHNLLGFMAGWQGSGNAG